MGLIVMQRNCPDCNETIQYEKYGSWWAANSRAFELHFYKDIGK